VPVRTWSASSSSEPLAAPLPDGFVAQAPPRVAIDLPGVRQRRWAALRSN
jgi:hypothetical protein